MEFPYIYSEWRESTSDFQPATPFGSPGHKVAMQPLPLPRSKTRRCLGAGAPAPSGGVTW